MVVGRTLRRVGCAGCLMQVAEMSWEERSEQHRPEEEPACDGCRKHSEFGVLISVQSAGERGWGVREEGGGARSPVGSYVFVGNWVLSGRSEARE